MEATTNYKYHSPKKLATVVLVFIGIEILFTILMIMLPPDKILSTNATEVAFEGITGDTAIICIFCVGPCIVLAFLVPFFLWVYRTCANAWSFSSRMTFLPGWAVGWFFVPILNIVRAPQVLQQIWKESNPQSPEDTRPTTILGWSGHISGWWFFLITSNILGYFAAIVPWTATLTNTLSHLFSIISSVFMIYIILQITKWQETKSNQLMQATE